MLDHVHLLRVAEVASLLDCSRRHVFTLLATGRLRAIKLSTRALRISKAELERFVGENAHSPANAHSRGAQLGPSAAPPAPGLLHERGASALMEHAASTRRAPGKSTSARAPSPRTPGRQARFPLGASPEIQRTRKGDPSPPAASEGKADAAAALSQTFSELYGEPIGPDATREMAANITALFELLAKSDDAQKRRPEGVPQ